MKPKQVNNRLHNNAEDDDDDDANNLMLVLCSRAELTLDAAVYAMVSLGRR
jgi:hypothetical protein